MLENTQHYGQEGRFEPGGPAIAIARSRHQQEHVQHTHDFNELVLVVGGRGIHRTSGERYAIERGDVFVVEHAGRHGYESTNNLEIVNVLFDPERLRIPLRDLHGLPGFHALFTIEPTRRRQHGFSGALHLAADDLYKALVLVDELESELDRQEPGYRLVVTAQFLRLVAFLGRAFGKTDSHRAQEALRLGEVLSWLQTHSAEPMRVNSLARRAHLSSRQFHRLFKAATGKTPLQYQLTLRIGKAKQLLRETPDTLTDIAFAVGFTDSNYFSRQFRQQVGINPRAYRYQGPP